MGSHCCVEPPAARQEAHSSLASTTKHGRHPTNTCTRPETPRREHTLSWHPTSASATPYDHTTGAGAGAWGTSWACRRCCARNGGCGHCYELAGVCDLVHSQAHSHSHSTRTQAAGRGVSPGRRRGAIPGLAGCSGRRLKTPDKRRSPFHTAEQGQCMLLQGFEKRSARSRCNTGAWLSTASGSIHCPA